MKRKKLLTIILTILFLAVINFPVIAASVSPIYHDGNDSSAAAPPGYSYYSFGSNSSAGTYTVHFDDNGNVSAGGSNTFTITLDIVNQGLIVSSWSANFDVYSVIVKGGNGYNEYVYNTSRGDSNLYAPNNSSGRPADVSHTSLVFKITPPPPPEKGSLIVYKEDSSGTRLSGAEFTLSGVGKGTETSTGVFEWTNVDVGTYTLSETKVPDGYVGMPATQVTITKDTQTSYTAVNTKIEYGSLVIHKVDQTGAALAGAVFTLSDGIGAGVESPAGTHTWSKVPVGTYTLTETTVPTGYTGVPSRQVTITKDHELVIDITNTRDTGGFKVLKVDQNREALGGAVFTLTDSSGKVTTGVESPAGTHTWSGLPTGTYTLKETKIPSGYSADPSLPKDVVIGKDTVNTLTVSNSDEHCSLRLYKKDSFGSTIALNVTFRLDGVSVQYSSEKSSSTGQIFWDDLEPGTYTLTEVSAPDGYYYDTQTHNVTLLAAQENTYTVTNHEYVTVYAKKLDINSGAPLAGARFAIFNTSGGIAATQIGAPQTTNDQGIAVFGKAYGLKANVQYWVKEISPPPGYQNDSPTAYGYPVMINADGSSNIESPVTFRNTPLLQRITVLKYIDTVFAGDVSAGSLLDGTRFELWQNGQMLQFKLLSNGTCEFTGLLPGDYEIREKEGASTYYFNVGSNKPVSLYLWDASNNNPNPEVRFTNTFKSGGFAFIKHDTDDYEVTLAGAQYNLTGYHWNGTSYALTTYEMVTGAGGYASVTGLTPGEYTLKEVVAPAGYAVDPTTYNVTIYPGRTTEGEDILHVSDERFTLGTIIIAKADESNTGIRLAGVRFSLYKDSVTPANRVASNTTNADGNIIWSNLEPGNYIIVEDSTITGYQIIEKSRSVTLLSGGALTELFLNRRITTPTPTPPTNPPESTPPPTPSPTPTPTPTATPTPINTDELIIEDVDPAFGPETGEGDTLFITIGILLLIGAALMVVRRKVIHHK